MRIQVLFEHGSDSVPYGCSYIRLLLPLQYDMSKLSVSSSIRFDKGKSDVYIIERLWRPGFTLKEAENLVRTIRRENKKLIYTLDDNLLDLEVDVKGDVYPSPEQKNIIRLLVKEADGVIVSTSPLAERLNKLNDRVIVVPNSLDERLFKGERLKKNDETVTFGYMGTPSHESDLLMILGPLREFLYKNKDKVRFELVGVFNNQHLSLFEGLPVRVLDTTGHVEYPKFVEWMQKNLAWDFAIAPLQENEFSSCKSDIKYLDYGIQGIPAVFSNVTPYRETVRNQETGLLVNNDHDSWYDSLNLYYTNVSLRKKLSENCRSEVLSNRVLRQCYTNWIHAINEIISK